MVRDNRNLCIANCMVYSLCRISHLKSLQLMTFRIIVLDLSEVLSLGRTSLKRSSLKRTGLNWRSPDVASLNEEI